jgi:hypothetical protein
MLNRWFLTYDSSVMHLFNSFDYNSHEYEHDKAIEAQRNLGNIATFETFDHSLPPLKKQRTTSSSSSKV